MVSMGRPDTMGYKRTEDEPLYFTKFHVRLNEVGKDEDIVLTILVDDRDECEGFGNDPVAKADELARQQMNRLGYFCTVSAVSEQRGDGTWIIDFDERCTCNNGCSCTPV